MIIEPRSVLLTTRTEIEVRRTLPHARLRRIGAWVFLDHFGPTVQDDGMTVAAHPHTGLQTVTWMFEGAIDHRDSLGTAQIVKPGSLNLMTAGRGVAHSERSLPEAERLHAVQLWIALPDAVRRMAPAFEHLDTLPRARFDSSTAIVFIGSLGEATSRATVHSPLVGAEIRVSGPTTIPLDPSWEYGILAVSGTIRANGDDLPTNNFASTETGAATLTLDGFGTVMFIGGAPFTERLVMWWNFIARSHAEIVDMRMAWNLHEYPPFADRIGGWIPAPEMPSVTLTGR